MKIYICLFLTVIVSTLTPAFAGTAKETKTSDATEQAVRQVVRDMNTAVSNRNLNSLLGLFDTGALRIDLFPAHNYQQKPEPELDTAIKSSDLSQRWITVAQLLSSTAKSYQRNVKNIELQVDGDMAIAWVGIETSMVSKSVKAEARKNSFIEVLLLRRQAGIWKISALTNNRSDR